MLHNPGRTRSTGGSGLSAAADVTRGRLSGGPLPLTECARFIPLHPPARRVTIDDVPTLSTELVFAAAALALLVFPGPSVLYIVSRSVDHGRQAGLASVLGVHTGSLVHVIAATIGLSALLVSSATAFTIVKYVGATYLVVLGLRQILDRR